MSHHVCAHHQTPIYTDTTQPINFLQIVPHNGPIYNCQLTTVWVVGRNCGLWAEPRRNSCSHKVIMHILHQLHWRSRLILGCWSCTGCTKRLITLSLWTIQGYSLSQNRRLPDAICCYNITRHFIHYFIFIQCLLYISTKLISNGDYLLQISN